MQQLLEIVQSMTILDIIDITIISLIIYNFLVMIQGSKATQMIFLIAGIVVMLAVSRYIGLRSTSWLISNFTGYLFILVIVIFQPELRRVLVTWGNTPFFSVNTKTAGKMIDEIVKASVILANRQIGALIIIERKDDILPLLTVGQYLDAEPSKDLLFSIFIPYSPMHDGAVVINGSRISYAGCILPLTKRDDIDPKYGTRHRAAFGISEETDAIAIVVSEERGSISMVVNGEISGELSSDEFREQLEGLLAQDKAE